jgi:hypothetical protein
VLEPPSDEDLRWRLVVRRGDFREEGMLQPAPAGERTVRLDLDPVALAVVEELSLVEEGMELHLIDCGRHRGGFQQFL